ncbi:hypothetical protein H1P_4150002 [Hyella patelloides LEGE 07179]|uniref:Uncharacterized protein n=1 Tax=Hyella patelloides LEGE 07179 TaxID=945734 RepID=A0A563VXM3_9CYAN|nr:hypothetical protein [Hyella patelloides]VEP16176.1 hypothetical protein H1P_4150002 [Hyella patelloides LEGE 07179]
MNQESLASRDGSMSIGVPVIPKEKVEQILQANNQDVAADVIQAGDEQL